MYQEILSQYVGQPTHNGVVVKNSGHSIAVIVNNGTWDQHTIYVAQGMFGEHVTATKFYDTPTNLLKNAIERLEN